jgi:dTDP-4-dehydrorhamnose 3,5-epimerase
MTIKPTQSVLIASPRLSLKDFTPDQPNLHVKATAEAVHIPGMIEGIKAATLAPHSDARGSLCELITTRDRAIEPIVHVYQVTAGADSRRAWDYHSVQSDRLAFVSGCFRIALYDVRPHSPTFGMLNVFILGRDHPGLLHIPPLVIHGVHNMDRETATFINLPTKTFDPGGPDNFRIPENDPRIPFNFDD